MENKYKNNLKNFNKIEEEKYNGKIANEITKNIKNADDLKLTPPWNEYVTKVKLLFEKDPDVAVSYDENEHHLKLYIDNVEKADALSRLLPTFKDYGGQILKISVVPFNSKEDKSELFRMAFKDNPIVSRFEEGDAYGNPWTYILFKPEVVQYFNDDIGDFNKIRTTVWQEIANEVFELDELGVSFCTDLAFLE